MTDAPSAFMSRALDLARGSLVTTSPNPTVGAVVVAEGWYPDDVLAPRRMWCWLLYRKPFGPVEFTEVRIYVRTI